MLGKFIPSKNMSAHMSCLAVDLRPMPMQILSVVDLCWPDVEFSLHQGGASPQSVRTAVV